MRDLKIYWESHGHPPGPYLVPHFDFHFFTVDADDVNEMDCSDETKPANPPAGYELPDVDIPEIGNLIGLCVPAMGMHALRADELASEDAFSGTMVVGYYAGEPIFIEPMITRDLLMEQATFSLDTPSVAGNPPGVTMPTEFEAVYDAEASAYEFVFSGFGG